MQGVGTKPNQRLEVEFRMESWQSQLHSALHYDARIQACASDFFRSRRSGCINNGCIFRRLFLCLSLYLSCSRPLSLYLSPSKSLSLSLPLSLALCLSLSLSLSSVARLSDQTRLRFGTITKSTSADIFCVCSMMSSPSPWFAEAHLCRNNQCRA